MTTNIKKISEVVSQEEADFFINYINNNIEKFDNYLSMNNPRRYVWRFGVDQVWTDSNHTLEKLSDIEGKLQDLFSRITYLVKEAYQEDEELYITSFHLAKQFPGAIVAKHLDAGPDDNGHFKYSFVLYLNASGDDGKITFDALEYSYTPVAREAIAFPSQGEEYEHSVNNISYPRYSLPIWITNDPKHELQFA